MYSICYLASNVVVYDSSERLIIDPEEYQLLTTFQIKPQDSRNKLTLKFSEEKSMKPKKLNNERLKTDESNSSSFSKEEATYLVVRKIKDINNEQKGYKLSMLFANM